MANFAKVVMLCMLLISISLSVSCNNNSSIHVASKNDMPTPTVSVTISPEATFTMSPIQTSTPGVAPTVTVKVESALAAEIKVPILYYHCVSDNVFGLPEMFVSPKEFEKQMQYLKDNNYDVITFEELDNYQNYRNPVIITFDDGYENNYLEAYPILKRFNYRATIFVCTNFINSKTTLKESQIKEMADLINFQSHTLSHPDLTALNSKDLDKELSESKKIIEKLTGKEVIAFAYPTGYYNSKVISAVKKYYKYAVTNKGGMFTNESSHLEIKRVYIPRDLKIDQFAEKIKTDLKS